MSQICSTTFLYLHFLQSLVSVLCIWARCPQLLSPSFPGLTRNVAFPQPRWAALAPMSPPSPPAPVSVPLSCCWLAILFSPTINICSDLFTTQLLSLQSRFPGKAPLPPRERPLVPSPGPGSGPSTAEPEAQPVTASGCVPWGPPPINQMCKRPTHKSEKEFANSGWA